MCWRLRYFQGLVKGLCVGHIQAIAGGLPGILCWVGHGISLPEDGLQDGQMQGTHVILCGFCPPALPTLATPPPAPNPLEKRMGKRSRGKPNPQSHFGNVVMEALLTSRCLLELNAVPKLLGFGESSA